MYPLTSETTWFILECSCEGLLFNAKWTILSYIMARTSYSRWDDDDDDDDRLVLYNLLAGKQQISILLFLTEPDRDSNPWSTALEASTLINPPHMRCHLYFRSTNQPKSIYCQCVRLQEIKRGPLWSWSYGSWIYNYLCNQCLLLLTLWVRIPLRWVVLDTTLC